MKRSLLVLAVLIVLATVSVQPAAAQNRYIVRTSGGLSSVLNLCSAANCQVQGSLDGSVGQTYLVTSSGNLILNILNGALNFLESLLGIKSVEADQLLPIPQKPVSNFPSGLNDQTPVNYYGTVVWHGYAAQPAAQIIRLTDAQNGFNISGTGVVAVIDTGVDTSHPVLQPVLLTGYDFTRNQSGASEWLDVPQLQDSVSDNTSNQGPVVVQQSSAAILDQSSAAILDGGPYSAFGHGTMTTGLVHLDRGTAAAPDFDDELRVGGERLGADEEDVGAVSAEDAVVEHLAEAEVPRRCRLRAAAAGATRPGRRPFWFGVRHALWRSLGRRGVPAAVGGGVQGRRVGGR